MATAMSDSAAVSPTVPSLSPIETPSGKHARDLVKEYAKAEDPSDRTSKVLFALLDYLPSDSVAVVADDIISQSEKLRELADHYVSTVLFPSKFFPIFFLSLLILIPLPVTNINSPGKRWRDALGGFVASWRGQRR